MPFGKYENRDLAEIPKHYLRWLRNREWLGAWLVKEIDEVLSGKTVAASNESFEETLAKWKEAENG